MPSVYDDQQTTSIDDLERSFAGPSAEVSGSDIAAKKRETNALEAAYAAPSATTSGSQKLAEAKELAKQEKAGSDQVGAGYTPSVEPTRRKSSISARKRAGIAGAIIGLLTGTLTVGTLLTGPLEFIHFSKALSIPHFAATSHFSDSRLGKIWIYSRTKSAGDTRLDWTERIYKNRILASMKELGITPASPIPGDATGKLDYLKDWKLDPTIKGSPIEGKNMTQMREWAKETFGDSANVSAYKGSLYIRTKGFGAQVKTTYLLNKAMGRSDLSAAMRTRVLGKFFDITLHPLHIADQKLNLKATQLYDNWKTNREKAIKEGASPPEVTGTAQTTDAKGKPTTTPLPPEPTTTVGIKTTMANFLHSPTGKVTSGALLGAGLVCAARQVADNVGNFKYAQVIIPAMRTGMEMIALGDQIESGQDVNTTQLGYYAQQLVTRDSNGKILNSWSDASSIEANNGGSGGVPAPSQLTESVQAGAAIPASLQWTQNGAVSALCGTAGQALQVGVGVVSIAFGGGILAGIATAVAGGLITSKAIDYASSALSGDVFQLGTGALLGSQADYGAALASNMTSMQFAGNPLSAAQAYELDQQTVAYEQADFQQKSLIARVFDVQDQHSFASQVIDSNVFDARNDVASLQQTFFNPLKTFGSLFSNIFSPSHAFAASGYDYGFPTLGFSLEDQNNPLIAVPQDNAKYVGALLDSNSASAQTYIQRANTCYGIEITKGPQGWDAIPQNTDAFRNAYAGKGVDPSCSIPASQDPDWLRIRAFIADTASFEGWACKAGDAISCSNDGFN